MLRYLLYILFASIFVAILYYCNDTSNFNKYEDLPASIEEVKMGFIYFGKHTDGGWNQTHDDARIILNKRDKVTTFYKENIVSSYDFNNAVKELADSDCKMIAVTSYRYIDYIDKVSKKFPKIKFLHCSGYKTDLNLGNFFGKMYQVRYLAGILAGYTTKTGKVGYVASFNIPEVLRGVNAFTLGLKSIKPDAEVKLCFTDSWHNEYEERKAFKILTKDSCDLINWHQDSDFLAKLCEENSIHFIAYHRDMHKIAPNFQLAAQVWNWYPYYLNQVNNCLNGNWKPSSYWKGLKDDIVKLHLTSDQVNSSCRQQLKHVYNKIVSGELKVFNGPVFDNNNILRINSEKSLNNDYLLSMDWLCSGISIINLH